MRELRTSAAALGCARVVGLGYVDSGSDPTAPAPGGFARAVVAEAAGRLADLLREEHADLVTVYDRVGGYGHLDHVQVHRVGMEAARLAGTPRVLQATVDRDLLLWAARLAARLPGTGVDPHTLEGAYATGAEITHRIDVRGFAGAKRRAMAAHASQHSGGRAPRTLQLLLGLPFPVFRRVLGTEWFIDPTMPPGRRATHPLERG